MNRILLWKGLAVAGLALLLLLPLTMIEGLISARSRRQREVEANIAQSAADRQQVTGPLLALDYTAIQHQWVVDARTDKGYFQDKEVTRSLLLPPKTLEMMGEILVEERYRGLYKVQLFHLEGSLKGVLSVPQVPVLGSDERLVRWGRARMLLALSDLRGVQGHPQLQWQEKTRDFEPGAVQAHLGRTLSVDMGDVQDFLGKSLPFGIPALKVMGTQELSIAPVAEDTLLSLKSNWASPSFGGRFLPVSRKIGPQGFEAQWQVSGVARDLAQILSRSKEGKATEAMDIGFVEPVNIYLQGERAVKYGFLFVGLVFASFFFFEMLKRLPIHPMQYLLVGLSLALFFLLLISLSEHIAFLWAYLAASGVSVLLLGFYLAGALRGWGRALGFAGSLVLLYGVLYALLVSEDNALLMGSALLFAALAGVMVATRRLDWYGVGRPSGVLE